jgi:hypothetical protein
VHIECILLPAYASRRKHQTVLTSRGCSSWLKGSSAGELPEWSYPAPRAGEGLWPAHAGMRASRAIGSPLPQTSVLPAIEKRVGIHRARLASIASRQEDKSRSWRPLGFPVFVQPLGKRCDDRNRGLAFGGLRTFRLQPFSMVWLALTLAGIMIVRRCYSLFSTTCWDPGVCS